MNSQPSRFYKWKPKIEKPNSLAALKSQWRIPNHIGITCMELACLLVLVSMYTLICSTMEATTSTATISYIYDQVVKYIAFKRPMYLYPKNPASKIANSIMGNGEAQQSAGKHTSLLFMPRRGEKMFGIIPENCMKIVASQTYKWSFICFVHCCILNLHLFISSLDLD